MANWIWSDLRIDAKVRLVKPIVVARTNLLVHVDKRSTMAEATVYEKIGSIAAGTEGRIVDYETGWALVDFPAGSGWDRVYLRVDRIVMEDASGPPQIIV